MAILQGVIAQQAATQGTIIGGAGGAGTLGARPGMGDPDDLLGGNRRPGDPGLAGLGLVILTVANTIINRYNDNKNDDEPNCNLFDYKDKDKQCKGGIAHHVVPDRCWRSPGTRGKWTSFAPLDAAINDAIQEIPVIGKRWKGGYYYGEMDEGKGKAICVNKKQHLMIHQIHDHTEDAISKTSNLPYTTNLKAEEELGAKSVAAATGCNEKEMADKLRAYHQSLGFNEDKLVRADPWGKSGLSVEKFGDLITKRKTGGIGF